MSKLDDIYDEKCWTENSDTSDREDFKEVTKALFLELATECTGELEGIPVIWPNVLQERIKAL